MKEKPFAITLTDATFKANPNHYEYGFVVQQIRKLLKKKTGFDFPVLVEEDNQDEVWDIVQVDLKNQNKNLEAIGYVYDSLENISIDYEGTIGGHRVALRPSLNNTLFYYPTYHVALVKTVIFQNHTDYTHDLIFAESQEGLLAFLDYIFKALRRVHKNQLTVFIDTEDDVERERISITSTVNREDVFMEEQLKTEVFRSIDEFFQDGRDFFTKYNIPYKRGILLYGNPGNGKTTLVKSIAGSISAPVAYWQITEHTSSYSIKEVFTAVNKMAPMVLVIEDIDSMPESVRSVFLNTLDGATSKEGVFLIGTTNYPEKIDPALINRAGRFDRAYEIKQPHFDLRYAYLQKRKLSQLIGEEDVLRVAKLSDGFSIAQLNELYTSIALQWHYEQQVDLEDIVTVLKSTNRKNKTQDWTSSSSKMGF
ncbi:MAG TPA: AAA family ATPase [Candidatus Angelobacter sp.]|nr:AAA family ATPase [Candidatus Angelobacter sp.]